ncbi:hypothetical protein Efla_001258 [Eimeria flavescens]
MQVTLLVGGAMAPSLALGLQLGLHRLPDRLQSAPLEAFQNSPSLLQLHRALGDSARLLRPAGRRALQGHPHVSGGPKQPAAPLRPRTQVGAPRTKDAVASQPSKAPSSPAPPQGLLGSLVKMALRGGVKPTPLTGVQWPAGAPFIHSAAGLTRHALSAEAGSLLEPANQRSRRAARARGTGGTAVLYEVEVVEAAARQTLGVEKLDLKLLYADMQAPRPPPALVKRLSQALNGMLTQELIPSPLVRCLLQCSPPGAGEAAYAVIARQNWAAPLFSGSLGDSASADFHLQGEVGFFPHVLLSRVTPSLSQLRVMMASSNQRCHLSGKVAGLQADVGVYLLHFGEGASAIQPRNQQRGFVAAAKAERGG